MCVQFEITKLVADFSVFLITFNPRYKELHSKQPFCKFVLRICTQNVMYVRNIRYKKPFSRLFEVSYIEV